MLHQRHIHIALEHPSNAGVLRYLQKRCGPAGARVVACSPASVQNPYITLGAHPDLVSRLWDELTIALPARCDWVVHDAPVLVRPDTGIIFAFAAGVLTYALRLPPKAREELAAAAFEYADARAAMLKLVGSDRDEYLRAHTGAMHKYSDGAILDLAVIGEEWAFGRWLAGETSWLRSAYDTAL